MDVNNWLVGIGDVLVTFGIAAAWIVYSRQRRDLADRDARTTLSELRAVRNGVKSWGDLYFGRGYTAEQANERAQQDYDWIMAGIYAQVSRVPTEPFTSLIHGTGTGSLLNAKTIETANMALWSIGKFNQLVDQQTSFITFHLPQIVDKDTDPKVRQSLAEGARGLSLMVHRDGAADFGNSPESISEIPHLVVR